MKLTILALAASLSALASAQEGLTYDSTTGTYTCSVPNGAYCNGDNSNIIIRCTNSVGTPGNCNDNLSGYNPIGTNFSPCVSCEDVPGTAACSKNGIVYGASGAGFGGNNNNATTFPEARVEEVCATVASGGSLAPYMNATAAGGMGGGNGSASGPEMFMGAAVGVRAAGGVAGVGALVVALLVA